MSKELKQKRVEVIDLLRGISIFLMVMAHVETYWLNSNSFWLIGIKFLIVQIMGTSNFTFVAGIGFAFSYKRNLIRKVSENEVIKTSLSHTLILISIALIYNLIQSLISGTGFKGFWMWNILQCIAFSRLLGLLFINISKYYRFIIAIIWAFLIEILVSWMLPRYKTESFADLIFLIFFNPLHGDGILVFFPFFIFGTLIGELFQKKLAKNKGLIENRDLKIWFLAGLALFISGIVFGQKPIGAERDYYELIKWIGTHPKIEISTLPLFIMPNSFLWVFYCAGWQIMFAITAFYFIDLKYHSPKSSNLFIIFGKYSLSIYICHYLLLYFPFLLNHNFSVNYIIIWFLFIGFEVFIWGIFYFLDKKWHRKLSLEYFIRLGSQRLISILDRKDKNI